MFDEEIVVVGIRAGVMRSQSMTVAVFDDETDDAIDENALDSECESIKCVARASDWRYIRDCMTRGDKVIRADGREYQVRKVGHDAAMGWLFKARRSK
jgi:hypothetical protein